MNHSISLTYVDLPKLMAGSISKPFSHLPLRDSLASTFSLTNHVICCSFLFTTISKISSFLKLLESFLPNGEIQMTWNRFGCKMLLSSSPSFNFLASFNLFRHLFLRIPFNTKFFKNFIKFFYSSFDFSLNFPQFPNKLRNILIGIKSLPTQQKTRIKQIIRSWIMLLHL